MTTSLVVGIHPDHIGEESYSDKWAEFLHKRGIQVLALNLLAPDALEQARQCDGVMWRWAHNPNDKQSAQRILYTIEHYLGIPVYPDSPTAWHYDEKISQFYLLQALQAPTPQTWLIWNREEALVWAQTAPYPVVFKLSPGASSSDVFQVRSEVEAATLINRAFKQGFFPAILSKWLPRGFPRSLAHAKTMARRTMDALRYIWLAEYPRLHPFFWKPEHSYAYFQEFLPGNDFDTRITVIGERAFGFRRLNRPGDFRASGSGRIVYNPEGVDRRCIEIAFQVSRRGRFQSMAYDFLYKCGEPVIAEISYAYADWAVHNCPGHWQQDMTWVEGQMWPEEAQVEDFLMRVRAIRASRASR